MQSDQLSFRDFSNLLIRWIAFSKLLLCNHHATFKQFDASLRLYNADCHIRLVCYRNFSLSPWWVRFIFPAGMKCRVGMYIVKKVTRLCKRSEWLQGLVQRGVSIEPIEVFVIWGERLSARSNRLRRSLTREQFFARLSFSHGKHCDPYRPIFQISKCTKIGHCILYAQINISLLTQDIRSLYAQVRNLPMS